MGHHELARPAFVKALGSPCGTPMAGSATRNGRMSGRSKSIIGNTYLATSVPTRIRNGGAGIDLSPAIRDYLGLGSLDIVDWRFVKKEEVPPGPWLYFGRDGTKLDVQMV